MKIPLILRYKQICHRQCLVSNANGKPKLIAYASKRLPEAAQSYSITELEMCGLAINIVSFSHLLKRVDFDAVVDHLALVHILKSKTSIECLFLQLVLYER